MLVLEDRLQNQNPWVQMIPQAEDFQVLKAALLENSCVRFLKKEGK